LKSLPEIFAAKNFENFLGLLAARPPEKFSDQFLGCFGEFFSKPENFPVKTI